MGFFSDLKEDLSQAVNELMPEEELDQAAVEETKEQPVENTQETTEETPMEPQETTEETPNDNAALEEMLKNLDSIEIPQEKEEQPEEETTAEAVLAMVQQELDELKEFNLDIGEGTVSIEETEDIDWINNWKQYFHQFTIDDVLVIPSWEEVQAQDQDKMILHIDPGTAFGTGMHDTTQLCIRQLKKYITPETVLLDVGTGSGILSILSLMFGAKKAVGTDLDPCAISATRENLEANQIPEGSMDVMIGNIIDDKAVQDQVGYEKYDIVTANILADVLIPLTPVICHQMKPGALYITSGILDVKEDVVVKAVKDAGLEILEVTHQGEWVSVTARKQA